MDTVLMIVTVVSVVVAAASAAVAWRVTHAERLRRTARVAALAAAVGVPRRSDAPAAVVVSAGPGGSATSHDGTRGTSLPTSGTPVAVGAIFGERMATSGSAGRQQWLMGAAGVFAAVVIAVAAWSFVGARTPGAAASTTPHPPVELLTLGHERTESGLSVAGVVRNAANGVSLSQLEADVRVFDSAGILIGTRSAPVAAASLAPGQEAPFAVALGELSTAARYRVSFRAAGNVVAHVDLRTNQPAALTAEAR